MTTLENGKIFKKWEATQRKKKRLYSLAGIHCQTNQNNTLFEVPATRSSKQNWLANSLMDITRVYPTIVGGQSFELYRSLGPDGL